MKSIIAVLVCLCGVIAILMVRDLIDDDLGGKVLVSLVLIQFCVWIVYAIHQKKGDATDKY